MYCGFPHDSERDKTDHDEGKAFIVQTHGPLMAGPPGPVPSLRLPPRQPREVFAQFAALNGAVNCSVGTVPEDSASA